MAKKNTRPGHNTNFDNMYDVMEKIERMNKLLREWNPSPGPFYRWVIDAIAGLHGYSTIYFGRLPDPNDTFNKFWEYGDGLGHCIAFDMRHGKGKFTGCSE